MNNQIELSEVRSLKDIKVLGYTTDFNQCECCGKEGLKGTVAILDLSSDVVVYYGSTCAAAANKYDTLDAAKKAKKDITSVVREYQSKLTSARGFAWKYIRSIYGRNASSDTLSENVWLPIVDNFENFYTNPINSGRAHPIFKTTLPI